MQRSFLRHLHPRKPWSSFQSQAAGSTPQSNRGGRRRQETCATWTSLWSEWCCFARACSTRPLLPLLKGSWCGFLVSRRHPWTGLLQGAWHWSPPLTSLVLKSTLWWLFDWGSHCWNSYLLPSHHSWLKSNKNTKFSNNVQCCGQWL